MEIQLNRDWIVKSTIGVVSFGAGVGVGYAIYAMKNRKFVRDIQAVMESIEEEALEQVNENQLILQPIFEEDEDEEIPLPVVMESVWPTVPADDAGEDWDWEVEERARELNPNAPYVIHRREYEDQDKEFYSQSTLTYYKGDDVLCDEHDVPVYNAEAIASPLDFGRGSGDPNVVYIRNDKLQAEYEVLLDHGYYSVEVLGQEIEHSFERRDRTQVPKFRPVD